jgi:hypothetical protein
MTPTVAARISSGTQLVATNATPALAMRSEPATRTRRRPIRSALVVSQSEMIASPTRVRVRIAPIVSGSRPSDARYRTSTTASEPYANIRRTRLAKSQRPSGSRPRRLAIRPDSRLSAGGARIAAESTWENAAGGAARP